MTVPRTLPTDDVLIVRKGKGKGKAEGDSGKTPPATVPVPQGWIKGETLPLLLDRVDPSEPCAMVLGSLDDVRWAASRAATLSPHLRVVIAPHIPSGTIPMFASSGIVALTADVDTMKKLRAESALGLPEPEHVNSQEVVAVTVGSSKLDLRWRAVGPERQWTSLGTARPPSLPGSKAGSLITYLPPARPKLRRSAFFTGSREGREEVF